MKKLTVFAASLLTPLLVLAESPVQPSGFSQKCEAKIVHSISHSKPVLNSIAGVEDLTDLEKLSLNMEKRMIIGPLHHYVHEVRFTGRNAIYTFIIDQQPDENSGDSCLVSRMKISSPGVTRFTGDAGYVWGD